MKTLANSVVALFLFAHSALGAKEGDSGPGWKVKSFAAYGGRVLYCEYDGYFRLKPQTLWYRDCGTSKKTNKYLTSDSLKCSNDGVGLAEYTKSRRQKWLVQTIGKGMNSTDTRIIEDKGNGCKQVYLSASVNPASIDYETEFDPVPLTLSKNDKWVWVVLGQDEEDGGIDCLKVELLSANQYTHINVNQECTNFLYNSDEGDWELIPASAP